MNVTEQGSYLVSSTGTVHVIERWDHSENHAAAVCGFEGEPEEYDAEEIEPLDLCGNCTAELGHEE
jgi:hypothetical protein